MSLVGTAFTLELVPRCSSVPREGWDGDHDIRPLSEQGFAQAHELAAALGQGIDAVYASPALRCRQSVEPLAVANNLPILEIETLAEAGGFKEPAAWVTGTFAPIAAAVGGAWAAGRMLGSLLTMADRHSAGRVVACSHGDVIPMLLAVTCAAFAQPVPEVAWHGDWYRLDFDGDAVTVTTHHSQR